VLVRRMGINSIKDILNFKQSKNVSFQAVAVAVAVAVGCRW
jgi:hypothetical protein